MTSSLDTRTPTHHSPSHHRLGMVFIATVMVLNTPAWAQSQDSMCSDLLKRNQPLQARPACDQAVALKANNLAALLNLGHTYLLAGDKAQAQDWYRKALPHIEKDEVFAEMPLKDFNLFINNGWASSDAQAAKLWFEQTWSQLKPLREAYKAAAAQRTPEPAQALQTMQTLLTLRAQTVALLGEGAEVSRLDRAFAAATNTVLNDLVQKQQPAAAVAFVETAVQRFGTMLPDESRWRAYRSLVLRLITDGQPNLASLPIEERHYTEQLAKLGADHPDTLTSMASLAATYDKLGQKDKEMALREKVLATRTAKLGADHPDTLTSMNNLAVTYNALGQQDKALALNEKTLAARTAKLGADHPDTLTSMSNLASIYGELGQYDKALALNEKTLAARTAKLGPDHPDTLKSMGNLAFTYGKLGQQDKALALEEKVLAARTAKLGADHPDTLVSMGNLASTYDKLGQKDKEMALREKVLATRTAKLGADHPTRSPA